MAERVDETQSGESHLDQVLDQFEVAWKSGVRPRIEDILCDAGIPRERLLPELVQTEMECRTKSGETVRVEEYVARFPELAAPDLLLILIQREIRARRRIDSRLSRSEYEARFPELAARLDGFSDDDNRQLLHSNAPQQRLAAQSEFGSYLILQMIGQGGMGQVYRALHRRMNRLVALKVLSTTIARDQQAAERFHREVQILARLSHPNIVAAYDAAETDGVSFFVMEYVDGINLSKLVVDYGPLSVDCVIECVIQAASGLAYAHQQGVVHRDVKPSNVLLSGDGTVKILDVGLARSESPSVGRENEEKLALTTTGAVMGTVDFMSPEQALNTRRADHRSDIYSLGCTMFFLLTGRAPYSEGSVMERLVSHREQPIPSLMGFRPDATKPLDAVFRRMVAKKPESRYASMDEVIEALQRVAKGAETRKLQLRELTARVSQQRPRESGGSGAPVVSSARKAKRKTRIALVVLLFVAACLLGFIILNRGASEPGQSEFLSEGASRLQPEAQAPAPTQFTAASAMDVQSEGDVSSEVPGHSTAVEKEHAAQFIDQDLWATRRTLELGGTVELQVGSSLRTLTRMDELKELEESTFNVVDLLFSETKVTDADLMRFANLTQLSRLRLRGCTEISAAGLKAIRRIPALYLIQIWGAMPVTSAAVAAWRECGSLHIVDISWSPPLDEDVYASLATLPHLNHLYLTGMQISDAAVEHLVQISALSAINLHRSELSLPAFKRLAELHELRHLACHGANFAEEYLLAIPASSSLESLDLSSGAWTHQVVSRLSQLEQLTKLSIHASDPSQVFVLGSLVNFKRLRTLGLAYFDLASVNVSELKRVSTISNLELSKMHINEQLVRVLAGWMDLKQVGVYDVTCDQKDWSLLKELRPDLTLVGVPGELAR